MKPVTPSQLLDAIAKAINPDLSSEKSGFYADSQVNTYQLDGDILLVEDNYINQQVAFEILRQMGLSVRVCGRGNEALSEVQRQIPDLILMDIQIPDIDGYEITRRIRAMPEMDKIPIIAMTANAMAGDAERSLEAGMNAHITKPVDTNLLYKTLKAWLPVPANSAKLVQTNLIDEHEARASNSVINFSLGVRMLGGNERLYSRLLEDFSTRFWNTDSTLSEFVDSRNWKEAEALLHTLNGVAGNIGAISLQQEARTLERLVKDGAYQALSDGLPGFTNIVRVSLESAKLYVAELKISDPEVVKTNVSKHSGSAGDLLQRLISALNEGDAVAISILEEIEISQLGATRLEQFRKLEQLVRDYDYLDAVKIAEALKKSLTLEDPN